MRRLPLAVSAAALFTLAAATPAAAQGELFIYNWSNYIPPELLEKFTEETGIKTTLDVYDSNETMLAKLQAGATGYDIIVPSGYMVGTLIEEGLVQKIDVGQMENFSNVAAPHDSPPFDPDREYSAPYLWGTTGFSYDDAAVEVEISDSWQEFFEPDEALHGRIAALNDEVEVYNAAAYYLGIDKCTEDPAEAQRILDLLEAQKPHLAMYSSEGTIDRMIAGEVLMHMQWNGAAHRAKLEKPSITYVYPKEGTGFWNDNLMVPMDAPNLDNAETFINWMMRPENIAMASNFAGYMNSIKGSEEYLEPGLKEDPAVNMPEEYADRLVPTKDCSAEARELRNRVWTRLKV